MGIRKKAWRRHRQHGPFIPDCHRKDIASTILTIAHAQSRVFYEVALLKSGVPRPLYIAKHTGQFMHKFLATIGE